MKILILEDDHIMSKLLTTLLKLESFEVTTLSIDDTLTPESIAKSDAETILMDINLGHQSSLDWLPTIRELEKKKHFFVISSGMDKKNECMSAGADAFLLKPYMPDDLINILNHQGKEK